jgi:predicted nucleic acid-binding Zn ribbon protein
MVQLGRMKKPKTLVMTKTVILTDRECVVCGKKFEGWGKKKYCSLVCGNRAAYQRHAEERRETRMAKYYAEKKAAGKK